VTVLLLYVIFYAFWQAFYSNQDKPWAKYLTLASPTIYAGTFLKELRDYLKRVYKSYHRQSDRPLGNADRAANDEQVNLSGQFTTRENLTYLGMQVVWGGVGAGAYAASRYVPSPWNASLEIPSYQIMGDAAGAFGRRIVHVITRHWARTDDASFRRGDQQNPNFSRSTRIASFATAFIQKLIVPFAVIAFVFSILYGKLGVLGVTGGLAGWKRHSDEIHCLPCRVARLNAKHDPRHAPMHKIVNRIEIGAAGIIGVGLPVYTAIEAWRHQSTITYINAATIVGTFYPAYAATKLIQRAVANGRVDWPMPFLERIFTHSPDILGYLWLNLYVQSSVLNPLSSREDWLRSLPTAVLMAAWGSIITNMGVAVGNISYLPPPNPEDKDLIQVSVSPLAHTVNLLLMLLQPAMFRSLQSSVKTTGSTAVASIDDASDHVRRIMTDLLRRQH
jgi:hypothetical protein